MCFTLSLRSAPNVSRGKTDLLRRFSAGLATLFHPIVETTAAAILALCQLNVKHLARPSIAKTKAGWGEGGGEYVSQFIWVGTSTKKAEHEYPLPPPPPNLLPTPQPRKRKEKKREKTTTVFCAAYLGQELTNNTACASPKKHCTQLSLGQELANNTEDEYFKKRAFR